MVDVGWSACQRSLPICFAGMCKMKVHSFYASEHSDDIFVQN